MSDTKELHPNEIVRWHDGPKYFGYKLTQQAERIKSGDIPKPFALSEAGRAKAWTGAMIIEHQQRQRELSKRKGA
jgi:predicted DNA-binding transcriptional regulator AlpA